MTTRSEFPPNFAWGAATAAYQIEGATTADGRGPSIWDTFARQPGRIVGGDTGDEATDHYHRFRDDVELLAELGVNSYRFSISWSRLLPSGTGPLNPHGADFYRRLVETLLEHGIAPYATLYHWDLPQPIEDRGGWLERDTASLFADYAAVAQRTLGDLVSNWITLNEPWCSSFVGYSAGEHAPGLNLGSHGARAAHHLLRGHGLAVDALRGLDPAAKIGITLNLYSVRPASQSLEDLDAARRIEGLHNRFFLEPVLLGRYPEDVLDDLGERDWFTELPADDLAQVSRPLDFLGVNYYSRHTVAGATSTDGHACGPVYPGSEQLRFVQTGAPLTHMGWPTCPEGLIDVLEQAHELAPDLPLVITENGSSYPDTVGADGSVDDPGRAAYLSDHIDQCARAIRRGLPLAGYFAWSFMDNFEWAWGYSRRFGLIYVDYATQRRTIKSSGQWYRGFLTGSQPAGNTSADIGG